MALVELFIAETVVSSAAMLGLKKAQKTADTKSALMNWYPETPTPVVDRLAERWSGSIQNPKLEALADRAVFERLMDRLRRIAPRGRCHSLEVWRLIQSALSNDVNTGWSHNSGNEKHSC